MSFRLKKHPTACAHITFSSLAPSKRFLNYQNKQGEKVESLPKWNFDGSSTGQAPGDDSEVILRPCRIFKDPFRPRNDGKDNILVMCDTYTPAGEPLPTNSRAFGKLLDYYKFLS
jgi:hypothetical protein